MSIIERKELESWNPIRSTLLIAPARAMEISQGLLLFELVERDLKRKPAKDLLDGFLRLHSATDTEILAFARKWGCLCICKHGLPQAHNGEGKLCLPRVIRGKFAEPLEIWRSLSAQSNSIVKIATELRGKRRGSEEDWRHALEIFSHRQPDFTRVDPKYFREGELAECLDEWLWFAAIRPLFAWDKRSEYYRLEFAARTALPNLFSHLAMQLAAEVASSDFAVCSGCRGIYRPERRPDSDRRNYCPTCGRKAAVRDAARRFRMRQRQTTAD